MSAIREGEKCEMREKDGTEDIECLSHKRHPRARRCTMMTLSAKICVIRTVTYRKDLILLPFLFSLLCEFSYLSRKQLVLTSSESKIYGIRTTKEYGTTILIRVPSCVQNCKRLLCLQSLTNRKFVSYLLEYKHSKQCILKESLQLLHS